jgi:hypothetical protein
MVPIHGYTPGTPTPPFFAEREGNMQQLVTYGYLGALGCAMNV